MQNFKKISNSVMKVTGPFLSREILRGGGGPTAKLMSSFIYQMAY